MKKLLFLLSISIIPLGFGQSIQDLKKTLDLEIINLNPKTNYSNKISNSVQFDSSLTRKGDTTGIHTNVEYLMFHDEITDEKEGELLKLLQVNWVTNAAYDEFCKWVLDSLYREAIYKNTNPTGNDAFFKEDLAQLLDHDDYYKDSNGQDSARFDPNKLKLNRELYYFDYEFDWCKKFRFHQYLPIINRFNLWITDRFNKRKEVDERRLFFKNSRTSQDSILVSRDREIWAQNSNHPFDYSYNLANHYYRDVFFKNQPVQGVFGNQTKAYLIYLEKQFQNWINEKKLPYRIQLTLPSKVDLLEAFPDYHEGKPSVRTKLIDMTNHWQITNQDYSAFLEDVRDSLMMGRIYENTNPTGKDAISEEQIADMLNHPQVYYDEINTEWKEFDPSQAYINSQLFTLDLNYNWKKKLSPNQYLPLISELFISDEFITEIDYDKLNPVRQFYRYTWQDLKRKANAGELIWDDAVGIYRAANSADPNWNIRNKDMSNGMRRISRYSDVIMGEGINVYPNVNCAFCNDICLHDHGELDLDTIPEDICDKCPIYSIDPATVPKYDFKTNPEALVQGLTYAQAMAFYNWKFLNKNKPVDFDEIIYDELLPSEEEFQKIQAGEQIVKTSEKIIFPTPLFRYVVHVYAK